MADPPKRKGGKSHLPAGRQETQNHISKLKTFSAFSGSALG